jgi:hypothetical protein
MLLSNLQVTVSDVTGDTISLKTELGQTITVSHDLMPNVTKGMKLFIAADGKPLVSSEKHAKDVLNEIIQ